VTAELNHRFRVLMLILVFTLYQTAILGSGQVRRKAHNHPKKANVLAQLAPDVSVVAVQSPEAGLRDNVSMSKNGRYIAFTDGDKGL
jgi:hypothetical protein